MYDNTSNKTTVCALCDITLFSLYNGKERRYHHLYDRRFYYG